jgi:hypothetical protein
MPKHAPSVYVPLDANYLRDPRIRRAGPEAELLYLRGLAYAKAGETDGMVYEFDLDAVAVGLNKVPNRVAALIREKAWEERDEGWFITGWFNWNDPAEARRGCGEDQSQEARRQRTPVRWLLPCLHGRRDSVNALAHAIATALAHATCARSVDAKGREGKGPHRTGPNGVFSGGAFTIHRPVSDARERDGWMGMKP